MVSSIKQSSGKSAETGCRVNCVQCLVHIRENRDRVESARCRVHVRAECKVATACNCHNDGVHQVQGGTTENHERKARRRWGKVRGR